jgi:hypothetical protein
MKLVLKPSGPGDLSAFKFLTIATNSSTVKGFTKSSKAIFGTQEKKHRNRKNIETDKTQERRR